jgi:hypothetical protein
MRFRYSTSDPAQDAGDSLPRVPLVLHRHGGEAVETLGLVDSGATVNVLPFDLGVKLGWNWDERKAVIRLAGSLGALPAIPSFVLATIRDLPPVRLSFAWTRSSDAPLILGQTSFFMEFDVCFFRSQLEFEIKPRSPA